MSGYTLVNQDLNFNGIKCDVSGNTKPREATLYDGDADIMYSLNVGNYVSEPSGGIVTFKIPLAILQGANTWDNILLKDQFQLLLNNESEITGLYVTQQLPVGELDGVVSGNNKATFTVSFNSTTFNKENTKTPPEFILGLADKYGKIFKASNNTRVQTITDAIKQSDGVYKFTFDDASLNNGETYSILTLQARNNVTKNSAGEKQDIDITVKSGTRLTPTDKPSLLTVKSIDTLAEDGSGVPQIKIELKKEIGDFNFLAAQAVLEVLQEEGNNMVQSAKTFSLDVSGGQILDQDSEVIGDDASGVISIVIPKINFFGLPDGANFKLITRLDGKNQADTSGEIVDDQPFIQGNESISDDFTVNYPFASTKLEIVSVDVTNGTQTVQITLDQPLSNYFDNSGDLTSATIYADALDASGAVDTEVDPVTVLNIKNDLKSQIDTSGSTKVISVELNDSALDANYGKQLRMKIESKETNGGESPNTLEKSTDYVVQDCAPINDASSVTFAYSSTKLTSTITWSDAAESADKLTYIVKEVHGTDKKIVVTAPGTDDNSANQVATIADLKAGVKYQNSYIYQRRRPTTSPYPALLPELFIAGEEKNKTKFFAKGAPQLDSVTYALKDASATVFDRLVIKGDAQGHAIDQFYVLVNTKLDSNDNGHVKYKLVDASGVKDICNNNLDNDATTSADTAPGKFEVTVEYGSDTLTVDLAKQMVFAVMDTNSTVDPVNFQSAQDENAANYVKNYDAVISALSEFVETASGELSNFKDASSVVDVSLTALSNMLDASGLTAYDNSAAAVELAHAAWTIADASHVLAFTAQAAANIAFTDFSNNFLAQAKAETARLSEAKNNASQSADDQDVADAAYDTWNSTATPVNKSINSRAIAVDASGKVTYLRLGKVSNVTLANGNVPNNADALFDAIKTAFKNALDTANSDLTTANTNDTTAFRTLKSAIADRTTAYGTYVDNVAKYNKLRLEIIDYKTTWNGSLNNKYAELKFLVDNFDTKFALWKGSKDHYGYTNYYEPISTSESEVENKKAEVGAIKTTYILHQNVPAPLVAEEATDKYAKVENTFPSSS